MPLCQEHKTTSCGEATTGKEGQTGEDALIFMRESDYQGQKQGDKVRDRVQPRITGCLEAWHQDSESWLYIKSPADFKYPDVQAASQNNSIRV